MDYIQIAKNVLLTEAKELERCANNLNNQNIKKAIDIIFNLKGKLIVTGVGKSGLVGTKIAATLASTGTSSFFIHPTEAMHGDLGMIGKGDGVLAISYSGESEELIAMLPHIKRFDIPLIAMTKNKKSTLGKYANALLNIQITKEACPLGIAPTSSTTLTMALGDALAICLMKKRKFQKEDFASFHPGGSLGKQLFIKVQDIMRTSNLPIITSEKTLSEAIISMSQGKIGNVLITDNNNKLIGILSDGDLRRALMDKNFSLQNLAISYASKNPKTIDNENMLASDALKIIEKYKIQLLIITKNQKVKGVLHIHDLIEAGIK